MASHQFYFVAPNKIVVFPLGLLKKILVPTLTMGNIFDHHHSPFLEKKSDPLLET